MIKTLSQLTWQHPKDLIEDNWLAVDQCSCCGSNTIQMGVMKINSSLAVPPPQLKI